MNAERHISGASTTELSISRKYKAFISYSHKDVGWARWLTRKLETYRIPSALKKSVGDQLTLKPVFRDREELSASHSLGEKIRDALAHSDYLIVLCSPASAQSKWVNQEIIEFTRLHGPENILAVIIDGEPFANDRGFNPDKECFPEYLRFRLTNDGALTPEQTEPCAADFRQEGDGKALGFQKLAAGMLGVGLDALVRRDSARRMKTVTAVTVASLIGMLITTGLAYFAVQGQREAREQRTEAEGLIEFMLTDLRDKLEPVGRLDVLESVLHKVNVYYSNRNKEILSNENIIHRSIIFRNLGDVELMRENLSKAEEYYLASYKYINSVKYETDPVRIERSESIEALATLYWYRKEYDKAKELFLMYKDIAHYIYKNNIHSKDNVIRYVNAEKNLAILLETHDQSSSIAIEKFYSVLPILNELIVNYPEDQELLREKADLLAWVSSSEVSLSKYDEALRTRRNVSALLNNLKKKSKHIDWRLEFDILSNEYNISKIYLSLGQVSEAKINLEKNLQAIVVLINNDPTDNYFKILRQEIITTTNFAQNYNTKL